VTVIDGATNTTTTVAAGVFPFAVAVNPVTNKIYVANNSIYGKVTVIDGATNTTTTVTAGAEPYDVAVNPVTNKIYVANYYSDNVTVIDHHPGDWDRAQGCGGQPAHE
jgi:DNA-binding beta-propeller fold protein YncE